MNIVATSVSQWLLNPFDHYTLPLDQWVSMSINFLVENFRPLFQAIRVPVNTILQSIQQGLLGVPPLVVILLWGLLAWPIAGRKVALFSVFTLLLIGFVGAWEPAMITVALVVTSVIFCILFGMPLGIAMAKSDRLERWIRPMLDILQTLPTFVYLVPVVMLFGIGEVPGIIATVVYATPPLVRLTNLGIRQVSPEVVEAAIAFGASPMQVLWGTQLPLAMPTILTGVNQTVLFTLGMSVITSMIAVPGLGLLVLQGVGRLDVGLSAVGGMGIVLLAIILDQLTQAIGQKTSRS